MFIGNSAICLVDECSSGVDALARRKLQTILLSERSRSNRTIIFTTHFLDEADLLSDSISIMSKGCLKMNGTAPEIKHALGLYRIHLYHTPGEAVSVPDFKGVTRKDMYDQTIYMVPESARAAELLSKLEEAGHKEYQISGPTIEDAFMKISEEMTLGSKGDYEETVAVMQETTEKEDFPSAEKGSEAVIVEKEDDLRLLPGNRIGPFRQGLILFRKRATVFRRNALPNIAAFLIPIIASGLASIFLRNFKGAGCSPTDQVSTSDINSLVTQTNYSLVAGPMSRLSPAAIAQISKSLPSAGVSGNGGNGSSTLLSSLHMVDSLQEFNEYISHNFANITPGKYMLNSC